MTANAEGEARHTAAEATRSPPGTHTLQRRGEEEEEEEEEENLFRGRRFYYTVVANGAYLGHVYIHSYIYIHTYIPIYLYTYIGIHQAGHR